MEPKMKVWAECEVTRWHAEEEEVEEGREREKRGTRSTDQREHRAQSSSRSYVHIQQDRLALARTKSEEIRHQYKNKGPGGGHEWGTDHALCIQSPKPNEAIASARACPEKHHPRQMTTTHTNFRNHTL
jgi:hypothetical protein